MSTILYEWEFANHLCRVVESEPGIVHFEQARNESGGDPRVMEFQRTATPMGAANEIIQLHRALAEAEMLNRDLAAFYQGYQEDRNRRERGFEELKATYETSHASRVHADEAVLRLEADLEAARVQYNELLYAVEQKEPGKSRHEAALELIRRGQRSDNEAAKENPAVRAAREGK